MLLLLRRGGRVEGLLQGVGVPGSGGYDGGARGGGLARGRRYQAHTRGVDDARLRGHLAVGVGVELGGGHLGGRHLGQLLGREHQVHGDGGGQSSDDDRA